MGIAIDRRPFDPSDYPREPSAYTATTHFIQRFKDERRFLTSGVLESAIRDGDLRDNGDGCGCFKLNWGSGVAYYIVVGWHEKGYRIVITGWPWVHDRDAALDSGRWSSSELDTIEELNDEVQQKQ